MEYTGNRTKTWYNMIVREHDTGFSYRENSMTMTLDEYRSKMVRYVNWRFEVPNPSALSTLVLFRLYMAGHAWDQALVPEEIHDALSTYGMDGKR